MRSTAIAWLKAMAARLMENSNLENALDKLKVSCPHFAYYLGSLASKKALGLGYSKENEEFYFICDDDIVWDFG